MSMEIQELSLELKDRIDRRVKYVQDLLYFCKEGLGYRDLNKHHEELCRFLMNQTKFKLILMPRYSFKSSVATIAYTLWRLARNSNERVLIYSDAASKAVGFMNSIKAHIEGNVVNSRFRQDFGPWETDPRSGKWSESQIIVRSRRTSLPEPSVDTGGIETSKVGFHYDVIIFDDIVSDVNCTTKDQMDKVASCYQKSLSLLKPGGQVIMVGTRWHFGDLYGRIIAENDLKKNFGIFLKKAEERGTYFFEDIGLTKEFLEHQKKNQGSYVYSCLYQNEPTDPETAIFKVGDFKFYGSIKKDDLYITCTCDPAGEGEDFTAITVVGTDNNMDMHILEVVNQHLQPSDIIDNIINLHNKYGFKILGLETNFFRGMLRLELERRMKEERVISERFKLFGVHEFVASSRKGQGKDNRIRGLQPYHERGALKFPGERFELLHGSFSELAWQMVQYPHSAHDDILDSLAYHLPLIRKGGTVKKEEIQRNTAVWLEKREWEKELNKMHVLPRRWQKPIDRLAFS